MADQETERLKAKAQIEGLKAFAAGGGLTPGASGKTIPVPVPIPVVGAPKTATPPQNQTKQAPIPFPKDYVDNGDYGAASDFANVMAATRGEAVAPPTVLSREMAKKAVEAGVQGYDSDIDKARKVQGLALTNAISQDLAKAEADQWAQYPGGKEAAIKAGKYKLVGGKQVYDPTPEGKIAPKSAPVLPLLPHSDTIQGSVKKKEPDLDLFKAALGGLGGLAGLVQAYSYGRTGNPAETYLTRKGKENFEKSMSEDEFARGLEQKALEFKNQKELQEAALKSQEGMQANRLWAEKQAQDRLLSGQGAGIPWQNNLNLEGE